MYPFKKCPSGQCNLDFAELCGFCGSRTRTSTPERSRQRCEEVLVWLRLHGQRCSLPEVGWDVEGVVWDWVGGVWIKGGGVPSPTEEDRGEDIVSGGDQLYLKYRGSGSGGDVAYKDERFGLRGQERGLPPALLLFSEACPSQGALSPEV